MTGIMNKNRIVTFLVLTLFVMVALCGCDDITVTDEIAKQNESLTSVAGTVQLYHATEDGVEPDEGRYQLKQPDNLSAALEELIEQMQIGENLQIERYAIDENRNITLYIVEAENLSEEQKLLSEAAIVRSIQGLDVKSIQIILKDSDGKEVDTATYTDSSFYYYQLDE